MLQTFPLHCHLCPKGIRWSIHLCSCIEIWRWLSFWVSSEE